MARELLGGEWMGLALVQMVMEVRWSRQSVDNRSSGNICLREDYYSHKSGIGLKLPAAVRGCEVVTQPEVVECYLAIHQSRIVLEAVEAHWLLVQAGHHNSHKTFRLAYYYDRKQSMFQVPRSQQSKQQQMAAVIPIQRYRLEVPRWSEEIQYRMA